MRHQQDDIKLVHQLKVSGFQSVIEPQNSRCAGLRCCVSSFSKHLKPYSAIFGLKSNKLSRRYRETAFDEVASDKALLVASTSIRNRCTISKAETPFPKGPSHPLHSLLILSQHKFDRQSVHFPEIYVPVCVVVASPHSLQSTWYVAEAVHLSISTPSTWLSMSCIHLLVRSPKIFAGRASEAG